MLSHPYGAEIPVIQLNTPSAQGVQTLGGKPLTDSESRDPITIQEYKRKNSDQHLQAAS